MADKRVFIAFAAEDKQYRDLLKGHALNTTSPISYMDMSVKEPFDAQWKTRVKQIIQGCDGVIALISKQTRLADGAKWEMQCARDLGKPLMGVHIHSDDKGEIPPQLQGRRVIEWTWEGIANFINGL